MVQADARTAAKGERGDRPRAVSGRSRAASGSCEAGGAGWAAGRNAQTSRPTLQQHLDPHQVRATAPTPQPRGSWEKAQVSTYVVAKKLSEEDGLDGPSRS